MNSKTSKKVTPKIYYVYGHRVLVKGHPRFGTIARVGYTGNLAARNRQHERDARSERDKKICKKGRKTKSGWYFYNAIRKYGYDKFEVVVLKKCRSLEAALYWEDRLIKRHKTQTDNGGFNEIPGGQASPMTDRQVVAKMKTSCAKTWADPTWKKRQGDKARLVWSHPELRNRHSETITEAWTDPDLKARRGRISREVWDRPGYRERNSGIHAAVWSNPKMRAKQSKTLKEFWDSRPDYRDAKSLQVSELWRDPEHRAKMKKARAHIFVDPTIRRRHREATKRAMNLPQTKLRVAIGRLVSAVRRQTELASNYEASGDNQKAKRARYLASTYEKRLVELRDRFDKADKLA